MKLVHYSSNWQVDSGVWIPGFIGPRYGATEADSLDSMLGCCTCPQTFDNFWRRSDALSWSRLECGAGVWEGAISPLARIPEVKGETDEAVKSEGKGYHEHVDVDVFGVYLY